MCGRYWKWFGAEWDALGDLGELDPVEWAAGRTDWTEEKRRCYVDTILQQLGPGVSDWRASFMSMVKSGECYYG